MDRQPKADGSRTSPTSGGANRSRPRRRFPFLPVFLAFLLCMLALPFVLVRIAPLRQLLVELGTAHLGLRGRLALRVGEVAHFDPGRIELRDLTVTLRGTDGEWRELAVATHVQASWSLRDLFIGHARFQSVEVGSLRIAGPTVATWEQQRGPPLGEERGLSLGQLSAAPPLTIDALRLGPVLWRDRDSTHLVVELAVSDLQTSDEGFFAHVDSGRVVLPRESLTGRLAGGRASMTSGTALRISGVRLEAGGTRARVRAQLDPRESPMPLRLFLDCERVDPRWLIERLGWSLAAARRDSLSGIVDARLGARQALADLLFEGVVLGEPLREMTARVAVERQRLELVEFELHGAVGRISASGEADAATRRASAALRWQHLDLQSAWLPWLQGVRLGPALAGDAQIDLALPSGGTPELAGTIALHNARPWGIATRGVRFEGHARVGEAVYGERLRIDLPAGRIFAAGRWPLGEGRVAIDAELKGASLAALPPDWIGALSGTVSGAVQLSGAPHDPLLEGAVAWHRPRYRGWTADSLVLGPMKVHPVGLRGVAAAELWNLGRDDVWAEHLDLGLTRGAEGLAVDGQAQIPFGVLSWHAALDAGAGLRVPEAELRGTPVGDWSLRRPLEVTWNANALRADSLVWVSGESRIVAHGQWDRATQQIDGQLLVDRFALATLADWRAQPDTLRGHCSLTLSAQGALPDPTLELRLGIEGLQWGGMALGRAALAARWHDRQLALDGLTLQGERHRLHLDSLRLDVGAPLLGAFGVDSSRTPPAIPLANAPWRGSLAIDSLALGALLPRLGLDPTPSEGGGASARSLSIAGQSIPVRVVTPWDRGPVGVGRGELRGVLAGRFEIGGSPITPTLRGQLGIPDLRFGYLPLGDLHAALTYDDSLMTLERLELTRGAKTSWARGYYPLRFALWPPEARPRAAPVGVQAGLDALDLNLLSGLTPWLPDASGTLSGQLALEGTGVAPLLRGTLELAGGGFRIPGRSERIYGAEAVLDVRRNGLRIRSLDARTGRGGTVTAVGSFDGPNDFDLSAHIENARIFEEGRYEFLVTADLHAYTEPAAEGAGVTPHLQGAIEVHSGTLTQSLAATSGGLRTGQRVPWIIEMDVEIPERVRVSAANAKADVGEGELTVSYRWPHWSAAGSVEILDGTYRLLGNTFTITGGTLEFRDTGSGPDVAAEINAETQVTVASEEEGPTETVTIEVQVHGRPEELQVDLSSTPVLSEEEILELLSYGRFTRGGRFEPIAETQWLLFNTMIDRIETSLIRQTPLFSRVTINAGRSTDEPLRVTVRPIVRPGFMVNYAQDLALDPSGELLINYRLTRALYLRGGLFRYREGSGDLIDEYGLDLRFRFSYE
ncbi:MAG: hypothetical protein GF330_05190 [Candidatus Eisenbacteria bacterium]|nr:hypothetical protein [Candidatus Eisenbacteria bacterium]